MSVRNIVGTCLLLSGMSHGQVQQPHPKPDVALVLERYAHGDFTAIDDAFTSDQRDKSFVEHFQSSANRWIEAAGSEDRGWRFRVVTTASVDLVGRAVAREFDRHGDAFRGVLESLCGRLRTQRPSEFEHLFHLAAMSLLQGADDEEQLIAMRYALRTIEPSAHILHGAERFPDDSRFKLAWIAMRHETVLIASEPLAPGYLLNMAGGRFEADGGATRSLDDTLAVLATLVDDPAVGAEARLRRGVLQFLMDRPTEATRDLDRLATSADTFVRYNARMILGAIATRADNLAAAQTHYRDALAAVPAQTAATALAATLVLLGRNADAAAVLATLIPTSPRDDPWFQYGQRDYRLFRGYLTRMREMIVRR
ncbi:MAG: hypothetical protein AMXMBFR57_30750 [Acidimicrobiia bacterium]